MLALLRSLAAYHLIALNHQLQIRLILLSLVHFLLKMGGPSRALCTLEVVDMPLLEGSASPLISGD